MSFEEARDWYHHCVGEKGHLYHQTVLLPGSIRLLDLKQGDSLLDLGCGQGISQRNLPADIHYVGIDSSPGLLKKAKEMKTSQEALFFRGDASLPLPTQKRDFDAAIFLLSLQNMERPEQALQQAASHLKSRGKLLLVLNHPCFRIPRQSHWGIDEKSSLQYRRVDLYMSPQKIPIYTHPSKQDKSSITYSFHYPLSTYFHWLGQNGLCIVAFEEWVSDQVSEGRRAKMENRARKEFPLFAAILAQKTR